MRSPPLYVATWCLALLCAACAGAPQVAAQTATSATLASFAAGAEPVSSLVQARDGNYYGVTASGGANSYGSIYQMTPAGQLITIYSFTGGASDGGSPATGLVEGSDGALYGTTTLGGANDLGTIFRFAGSSMTTVHSFDPGTEGNSSYAALTVANDGKLYGILAQGLYDPGTSNYSGGAIFSITPGGTFTVLYQLPVDDSLGAFATARLLQASDGNFWGVTSDGGANGYGTLFCWSAKNGISVMHNFGAAEGSPIYGLTQSGTTLYGVTFPSLTGQGEIFSLALSGHAYTVVHSFTGETDGGSPATALYAASDGNLYGATQAGGAFADGTFFRITNGQPVTLYNFPAGTLNTYTDASLLEGSDTNFYLPVLYDATPDQSPMDGAGVLLQLAPAYGSSPPPPVLLTSNEAVVTPNQQFTLSWSLPDSASLSSQQCYAFSEVTNPAAAAWSGLLPASGSQSLTLTTPGSYGFALNCGGSVTSIVQVAVSNTTSTTLSAPASVVQGQTATLSATVTAAGGGNPTGTVQFIVDGSYHLATVDVASGKASFSASTRGVATGNYSVKALYSGDANNSASSSASSIVAVTSAQQATSITFTASPLSVSPGQDVTFTATVTSKSGMPTGSVQLYYDTLYLGTATLKSGVATLVASSAGAPAGTYGVHMVYSGSSGYAPSTSSIVDVTVK